MKDIVLALLLVRGLIELTVKTWRCHQRSAASVFRKSHELKLPPMATRQEKIK